METFQRKGSVSNAHVGRDFEIRALTILTDHGIDLKLGHKVPCGVGAKKELHSFDLGSEEPPVIVECKSQTWTKSDKAPSAKLTNWRDAMFFFHTAPAAYRKIFVVEQSLRASSAESLLAYFIRTQKHMIPADVECWEMPRDSDDIQILWPVG